MDKDKALPIKVPLGHPGYTFCLSQRDADWECIQPLIEALERVANGSKYSIAEAMFALKHLGAEGIEEKV